MKEYINVLMKLPGKYPRRVLLKNDLKTLQDIVGGYIEVVKIAYNIAIVCNEEGRLMNLQKNVVVNGRVYVGPILIVGVDGEDFDTLQKCSISNGKIRYCVGGEIEEIDTMEVRS